MSAGMNGGAPPETVAAARERLLAELVAAVALERPLVLIGPPGDAAPPGAPAPAAQGPASVDGPLDAIEPGASAVLWVEAEPQAGRDDAVLRVLADATAAGSPVIVALAAGAGEGAADLLARRLSGARVLEHRVAEVAALAEAGRDVPVHLPAGGAAVLGRVVVAAGDGAALPPAAARAALPVASDVRDVQLRALEEANAALREANVRLAREHLGRYDSAAASVVHRLEVAQQRYEQEREIALENDRLFQDARRRLEQPHHRAADRLVAVVKRIPGGAALVRLLRHLLGR